MKNNILKLAGLNALATTLYIAVVASFLFYAPHFAGHDNSVLVPIAMLLLFVFSAAFTGLLILGRPVLWYLDGKKKEAVSLFITTLVALFIITFVAFFVLTVIMR